MTDQTPDRDEPSGSAERPKSAAKWMRDWRRRQREKKRSLRTNYTDEFLNQLVSDGRIRAEELDDPDILGAVLEDICDTKQRGNFEAGPICATGTATG